jgi:hypothetical protein
MEDRVYFAVRESSGVEICGGFRVFFKPEEYGVFVYLGE